MVTPSLHFLFIPYARYITIDSVEYSESDRIVITGDVQIVVQSVETSDMHTLTHDGVTRHVHRRRKQHRREHNHYRLAGIS